MQVGKVLPHHPLVLDYAKTLQVVVDMGVANTPSHKRHERVSEWNELPLRDAAQTAHVQGIRKGEKRARSALQVCTAP